MNMSVKEAVMDLGLMTEDEFYKLVGDVRKLTGQD
jgi:hypothetical protein